MKVLGNVLRAGGRGGIREDIRGGVRTGYKAVTRGC